MKVSLLIVGNFLLETITCIQTTSESERPGSVQLDSSGHKGVRLGHASQLARRMLHFKRVTDTSKILITFMKEIKTYRL